MDDASCASLKDVYKHSIRNYVDYSLYSDSKYVSFFVTNYRKNLCTNEMTLDEPDIFIYDVKNDKRLSNEDIMKIQSITEDDIIDLIKYSINEMNSIEEKNYTINDTYQDGKVKYYLYYNSLGELLALYKLNPVNGYYSVKL